MAFDRLAWQKEHRKKNANADTKKYEKTHKGFLMRLFRNIESRISGIQKEKYHLYKDKTIDFTREEFYQWALSSETFLLLFQSYKDSEFKQALAPSVDRINSNEGYNFENIEWVTHSENSRRGANSQWKALKNLVHS